MLKMCEKKFVSKRELGKQVKKLREKMKKNNVVKELFKEYDVPISLLDEIPIGFAKMDVSAKTKDGKILFNVKFLEEGDGEFKEDHYCVHELTHVLQQITDSLDPEEMKKPYLDNEHEKEAFERQIEYKSETDGRSEAERYANQVLDHHKLEGKKRDRIKTELMAEAALINLRRQQILSFASKAKHNYKKKKVEESGNVTYIYDEKHIENRNKKKAEKVKKLEKIISDVRKQVKKDITDEDPKIRLSALAVALIDETYERVGNRESARELKHYGVTEWLVKHIKFIDGKAKISYVGKSGVKQKKEVCEKSVLKALKDVCKGKSPKDQVLSEDKFSLNDNHVNYYLRPFKITAKDIRGFHANEEMRRILKETRKSKLPSDQKAKEKKLKDEFKKALEQTAKIVGHEASTLKSQYLVPSIEENYLKNGKI